MGVYRGLYTGTTIGVTNGGTRSLDYSSFRVLGFTGLYSGLYRGYIEIMGKKMETTV